MVHALFFQIFWHIAGSDIIAPVKNWWGVRVDLETLNPTNIVLIPKVKDPKSITEFRPISLFNVFYKIISKTLANRLKTHLPHLVSHEQIAFVPNHLITDNALVAFEIFHSAKRKKSRKRGSLALKLRHE